MVTVRTVRLNRTAPEAGKPCGVPAVVPVLFVVAGAGLGCNAILGNESRKLEPDAGSTGGSGGGRGTGSGTSASHASGGHGGGTSSSGRSSASSSTSITTETGDSGVPVACDAGQQKVCGGACVSVADPTYGCSQGGCTACSQENGTVVCSGNVCTVTSCFTNYKLCGSVCVPTDAAHGCGASACTACPSTNGTAICTAAHACDITCPANYKKCGTACVAVSDPAYGCTATSCDTSACPSTSGGGTLVCSGGACVVGSCGTNTKNCNNACVPTDATHGCAVTTTCAACASNQTCVGAPAACACIDEAAAKTCSGVACGSATNNCGKTVNCPDTCTAPNTCSGGGAGANGCGCTPLTSCPVGTNCGTLSDGCSGTLSCGGACPSGEACGAVSANTCGCWGGRVAVYRYKTTTSPNTHCFQSGSLQVCSGTNEGAMFYAYPNAVAPPGLAAVGLCSATASGRPPKMLAWSGQCPSGYSELGVVGYNIQDNSTTTSACGSVPLYQLNYNNLDRIYVTPGAEYDQLVGSGWTLEGMLGHVWLSAN